ncbi:hypothetical protein M409DRAFT_58229 [Zasmidium cellare ATCC 36951]|uniref:SnoaL-like domain-containing protein n=1 Tax=Zasmidium cellare ATCC 36951 TaxID=1080233 RepID=A0A6A6C5T0_ZASCE|nr:uncharacterized protein M409DRAFT_58229 [Zasmidium cellare ATCC 36951]KAF2162464.1 hypothetical protein M409DRAFT_58229 [Zasmidium cellare ATCC 36951]
MHISTSEGPQQGATPMPKLLPKPSMTPVEDPSLESHIKNLVLTMINAMNTRDFNPSSPAWKPTTPDFVSEPSFHMNYLAVSLHDFLRLFDEQTRDHPEYFCEVKEVNVHVNSKRDHAVCFTEVETNGLPIGIVRSSVGIVEFVRVGEGEGWKCKKYRCMPGMEVLGVPDEGKGRKGGG